MRVIRLAFGLALVALVVSIVGLVVAIGDKDGIGPPPPNLNRALSSAASQSANAPAPPCNPPEGTGRPGLCAPRSPLNPLLRPLTLSGPHGVDVSSYQCPSQLPNVAFVFIKASEGTGYVDRCLARTVAAAKRQHILYGAYDFLRPSFQHTATAEANVFVRAVKAAGANGSLPPVADVEANAGLSPAQVSRYVCTWHNVVRRALHRSVSITYTGNWFWAPQVHGSHCGSMLWISAYASFAVVPKPWARYTFWQYSDGIYGPFPRFNGWDSNRFNGTIAQLRSLAAHPKPKPKPAPKPKPTPKPKPKPRTRLCHPRFHRHHICPPGTRRVRG